MNTGLEYVLEDVILVDRDQGDLIQYVVFVHARGIAENVGKKVVLVDACSESETKQVIFVDARGDGSTPQMVLGDRGLHYVLDYMVFVDKTLSDMGENPIFMNG